MRVASGSKVRVAVAVVVAVVAVVVGTAFCDVGPGEDGEGQESELAELRQRFMRKVRGGDARSSGSDVTELEDSLLRGMQPEVGEERRLNHHDCVQEIVEVANSTNVYDWEYCLLDASGNLSYYNYSSAASQSFCTEDSTLSSGDPCQEVLDVAFEYIVDERNGACKDMLDADTPWIQWCENSADCATYFGSHPVCVEGQCLATCADDSHCYSFQYCNLFAGGLCIPLQVQSGVADFDVYTATSANDLFRIGCTKSDAGGPGGDDWCLSYFANIPTNPIEIALGLAEYCPILQKAGCCYGSFSEWTNQCQRELLGVDSDGDPRIDRTSFEQLAQYCGQATMPVDEKPCGQALTCDKYNGRDDGSDDDATATTATAVTLAMLSTLIVSLALAFHAIIGD